MGLGAAPDDRWGLPTQWQDLHRLRDRQRHFPARRSEADIALLPVVSGYRGKQTQRLELTTFYRRIYEEIDKNEKREDRRGSDLSVRDMRVILPLSEIRSARLFDLELHAKVSGR